VKNQVFGSVYAENYDLFYENKDYEAECDLIQEIFRRHAGGNVNTILDLGCGTGNHTIPLAHRGYKVTGIDRSSDMVKYAEAKAQLQHAELKKAPQFIKEDVRCFELDESFDAVIMMFAVLGYQLTNLDLICTLGTIRKQLKPGGLFIFDVWYGPAVLAIRPGDKIKEIATADGKMIRMASGTLDVARHLCQVDYRLLRISANSVVRDSTENHTMRYFFPMELDMMLSFNNLKLQSLTAFHDPEKPADETTWNVLGVAMATGLNEASGLGRNIK
jgi:SAM-dependent methyltransferase